MSVDIGFDMRGTVGYVTDPANCTYLLGTINGDTYPVTRAGYTFGWNANGAGVAVVGIDRNAGQDPRLAGINFSGAGNSAVFQLDVSPATFDIYLAIGDAGGTTSQTIIDIYDDTSLLWTVTQVSTTGNSFTDSQGNEYTAANWPGSNQPRSAIITSTKLRLHLRAVGGAAFGGLAFLGVLEQGGGGTTFPGYQSPFGWR